MPEHAAEVVVVGASVAGLACAAGLAEADVDVLVLDARPALLSGDPGLALVGTAEAPHRLVGALGLDGARELVGFSRESVGALPAGGSVTRAFLPRDEQELDPAFAAAQSLGLQGSARAVDAARARLGPTTVVASLMLAADRTTSVLALKRGLAARIARSGGRLRHGATVGAVHDRAPAVLDTTVGEVSAELVVLACGHTAATLEPWLGDKLWPVRCQSRRLLGAWPWGSDAVVAQQGHLWWRGSAGRLVHGGARWATPHLEVGETLAEPSAQVSGRLHAVHRQVFPAFEAPVMSEVARIEAVSCDHLPLVGARPGGGRTLLLTGFGEHELSWALAAASALVDGIVHGTSPVPGMLQPARLMV